jgi:hypothetical protein
MAYFVGQEIVSYQGRPVWSMSYAGGVLLPVKGRAEVGAIYTFLRLALRQGTVAQRTLEAVSCTPWFGAGMGRDSGVSLLAVWLYCPSTPETELAPLFSRQGQPTLPPVSGMAGMSVVATH